MKDYLSKYSSPIRWRWALTATLVLGLLMPPMVSAQIKIGFVDVAKVLDTAPQEEAARIRLEKEFAPRDRELLQQQRKVRSEEDRLVKNGAIMASSERNDLEAEIRRLKRELRRTQEEFREDYNLRRSQELSKLQREVIEVIQTMGRDESYDVIVTTGVVFAGERVDITERVIERLNADFQN